MMNKPNELARRLMISLPLILFAALCVFPLLSIVSISFSDEGTIVRHGYSLVPRSVDLEGYRLVLRTPWQLLSAYWVSIRVAVIGGLMGIIVVSLGAYALSREEFVYRKPLTFYVLFTILFSGGLVPQYILFRRYLHIDDTLWVLILPYVANAWYVFILRTFFRAIPGEMIQAARIDGAGELRTYVSIVVPMSTSALVSVLLFLVLRYWNDWWLPLLYISRQSLVPLQFMLYRLMAEIEFLARTVEFVDIDMTALPTESTRMAMVMLAAGPVLFVFPFFQRYFVKGLRVGAVKG